MTTKNMVDAALVPLHCHKCSLWPGKNTFPCKDKVETSKKIIAVCL